MSILPPDDSAAIARRAPPADSAWRCVSIEPEWTRWYHPYSNASVLSAVETPEPDIGPEWHVSVTVVGLAGKPVRAGRGVVAMVLRDFGMVAEGEDNHVRGGVARHFWLAVNADQRGVCPCVETERAEVTPIPGAGEEGDEFVFREEPKR